MTLKEEIEALERKRVEEQITAAKGNRDLAAQALGLSRQGLDNKLARYGIKYEPEVCPTCGRAFQVRRPVAICSDCQYRRVLNQNGRCRHCEVRQKTALRRQDTVLRGLA